MSYDITTCVLLCAPHVTGTPLVVSAVATYCCRPLMPREMCASGGGVCVQVWCVCKCGVCASVVCVCASVVCASSPSP